MDDTPDPYAAQATGHEMLTVRAEGGYHLDVAVTMGCGDACPLVRAGRREEWNIPDPKELPDEEFRKVRDLIERKVKELLAAFTQAQKILPADEATAKALKAAQMALV